MVTSCQEHRRSNLYPADLNTMLSSTCATAIPISIAKPCQPNIPDFCVDIRNHGAVSDGSTSNTAAIAAAISACAAAGGGRVLIPAGVWVTGPIHWRSRIEIHLAEGAELRFSQRHDDYLPVVRQQRGGIGCMNYSPFLYAVDCEDIALTGPGLCNGQGAAWWPWKKAQPGMVVLIRMCAERVPVEQRVFGTVEAGVRSDFCQFVNCQRVLIEGPTFMDSPAWTIHPVRCDDVTIRQVTVRNPKHAPNTDGIDPDGCRRVLIEHCHVDTGDDGICLKSGWNEDGFEHGRPCEDVLIRHCTVLAAHGGFVIGSEVSGGIQNIHVHDCFFDGTNVGVRIKTKPGRGAFIRNIHVERLRMHAIRREAVLITQFYNGNPHDLSEIDPTLPVTEIDGVSISALDCDGCTRPVRFHGLSSHPLRGIKLIGLNIRAAVENSDLRNVADVQMVNVSL